MLKKIKDLFLNKISLLFPVMYFILGALSFNGLTARRDFLIAFIVITLVLGALSFLGFLPKALKRGAVPGFWLCVAFVISYGISSYVNRQYGITENLQALCWLGLCMAGLYPAGVLTAGKAFDISGGRSLRLDPLKLFITVLLIYTGVAALGGLLTLVFDIGWLREPDVFFGFIRNRLNGFYTDPNYGGVLSVAAISVSVMCIMQGREKHPHIWVYYVHGLLQYLYLSFTFSRTAQALFVIGTVILFVYFAVTRKKAIWKKLLILVICVALCIGLDLVRSEYNSIVKEHNKKAPSTSQKQEVKRDGDVVKDLMGIRMLIWEDGVSVVEQEPAFGVSYRNISPYLMDKMPDSYMVTRDWPLDTFHNCLVDVGASQGLTGLTILAAFVILLLVKVFGNYKKLSREDRDTFMLSFAPVLMIMGGSMMISDIFYINSPSTVAFWFLLGQSIGRVNIKKEVI